MAKAIAFWMALAGHAQAVEVRVVLTNYAEIAGGVAAAAMTVTDRTMMAASVRPEWAAPGRGTARAGTIYVKLLPERMAGMLSRNGWCAQANPEAATVWISVSCAMKLADGDTGRLGLVLGYLMAHEVGHVLLGDHLHDDVGLMRANWGKRELAELRTERLQFGDPDKLRARAERWVAGAWHYAPGGQ